MITLRPFFTEQVDVVKRDTGVTETLAVQCSRAPATVVSNSVDNVVDVSFFPVWTVDREVNVAQTVVEENVSDGVSQNFTVVA